MDQRRTVAVALSVVAGLVFLHPATASPIKWLSVHLGTHRFGHLRAPDAIVARAGPEEVGFWTPPKGECGCGDLAHGPRMFDVARDGSIWVLDDVNHRLLVWRPGRPARPARAIRLRASLAVRSFALGPTGTIYAYATDLGSGHTSLYAFGATGRVLWQERVKGMTLGVSTGADGVLYAEQPRLRWMPLTTPAGRPLHVAARRRQISPFQVLPGGLRLLTTSLSAHEVHAALVDRTGKVVRAWRVTSQTQLGWTRAWPGLVGGEPVILLDASRAAKRKFLWEHLVLRLTAAGTARQEVALDARAVWGDDGSSTALRIGPDGQLYQLRTDPKAGMSIARYSLGPT